MSHLLPITHLNNDKFQARILRQGAQLLSFVPNGQKDWLFDNPNTPFEPGKEVYGGVPIVFPWFSLLKGHEDDAPNHGFARQANWTTETQSDELVSLSLSSANIQDQGLQSPFWAGDFFVRMVFSFGEGLGMRFEVQNRGDEAFAFECALHTYFAVSDVRRTTVEGAENGIWLNSGAPTLTRDTAFPPFGARLFEHSQGPILIREPERTFRISNNEGWRSSVVWNPGEAMEDLNDSNWPHFVCVEAGALRSNAVSLESGESYALDLSIELN